VTHDEHLRIAYTLRRRHGSDAAAGLTARWSDLIGSLLDEDGDSYETFIGRHPELRAPDLLGLPAWKAT
jgi:hypothetical protein